MKKIFHKINNNIFALCESALSKQQATDIFKNYGVSNADQLSIIDLKKAYKKLVYQYHPDKGGNNKDMQNINNAYEVLKKLLKQNSENPSDNNINNYYILDFIQRFKTRQDYAYLSDNDRIYIKKIANRIIEYDKLHPYILEDQYVEPLKRYQKILSGFSLSSNSDNEIENASKLVIDLENEIQYSVAFTHALHFIISVIGDLGGYHNHRSQVFDNFIRYLDAP